MARYFSSIMAILMILHPAITFLISDCVFVVVYFHSTLLSGPLLQPDLDDGEEDVLNQDIVQLKTGLHQQVWLQSLHTCISLPSTISLRYFQA